MIGDAAPGGDGRTSQSTGMSASAARRPPTIPSVAAFLTQLGIDSISVNPESVARTMTVVHDAEQVMELKKVV